MSLAHVEVGRNINNVVANSDKIMVCEDFVHVNLKIWT
jgi:hypothetical protein